MTYGYLRCSSSFSSFFITYFSLCYFPASSWPSISFLILMSSLFTVDFPGVIPCSFFRGLNFCRRGTAASRWVSIVRPPQVQEISRHWHGHGNDSQGWRTRYLSLFYPCPVWWHCTKNDGCFSHMDYAMFGCLSVLFSQEEVNGKEALPTYLPTIRKKKNLRSTKGLWGIDSGYV